MSFAPGSRLGKFEIVAPLGVGGMGEVYRARDTALGRDVAIKVLPDSLALDRERVGRFEREARVLASLNHPNIAAIHDGLMREDATHFLVMELVEGETLAELTANGSLPPREILGLFRQVAAALEAAHGKGIVHRDLKPENVKITPEGNLKVLDFGLATELYQEPRPGNLAKTATAPTRWTRKGDILGTPAYMSPEQARGETLDKRTDIWSFGCCLFEALAGRHPFQGKTVSDVLAAVISAEPDFGALPSGVPRNIVHLLRRCLQKDRNRRLHDIGDARAEIEEALDRPEASEPSVGVSKRAAALGAVAALIGGIGLGVFLRREESSDTTFVRRFTIELPPTEPVAVGAGPALAITGDGARLAYSVRRGDTTELRLRAMDRLEPTRLPGTEGAQNPFFAPGGDSLGFVANGKLQRLSLADLAVQPIQSSPNSRGASFGPDGTIVFSPQTTSGLSLVSSASAAPVVLTELSQDAGERSHRWPSFLPDGERALFTSWKGDRFDVEIVSLETKERRLLVENGSHARFAPSGHLIFVRGSSLMGATFDAGSLSVGEPVSVIEGVHVDTLTGAALYDFSSEGTLVYAPEHEETEGEGLGQLLRVDRFGNAEILSPVPRGYQVPRLSPRDDAILVTVTEADSTDIWLAEVLRGSTSRLTYEGNNGAAIWSPDGERISFSSDRDGSFNLYSKADDSGPDRRLTTSPNAQFPTSWAPDGQRLVYIEIDPENQFDVWAWNAASGKSEPLIRTPFNESGAVVSPDGRFMAYVSDETGQDEVYVTAFPGSRGKWLISTTGGREPVWRDEGSELFYRDGDWMLSVAVETEPDFSAGVPRPLFEAPYDEAGSPYASYDVSEDGEDFIMVRSGEEHDVSTLVVVLGWFAELEAKLPRTR